MLIVEEKVQGRRTWLQHFTNKESFVSSVSGMAVRSGETIDCVDAAIFYLTRQKPHTDVTFFDETEATTAFADGWWMVDDQEARHACLCNGWAVPEVVNEPTTVQESVSEYLQR